MTVAPDDAYFSVSRFQRAAPETYFDRRRLCLAPTDSSLYARFDLLLSDLRF
jgi:hypothetical protein